MNNISTANWIEVNKLFDTYTGIEIDEALNYLFNFKSYLEFFLAVDRLSASPEFVKRVHKIARLRWENYWLEWNNIKTAVPDPYQPVVYYFDVFNKSFKGFYEPSDPLYGKHCFYSKYGFLTDDIIYWIGR